MLLQNQSTNSSDQPQTTALHSGSNAQGKSKKRVARSFFTKNRPTKIPHQKQRSHQSVPLWLQGLLLTKNISSLFCLLSVSSALLMYGMTVYAPELWTKKYNQLKELQKKERQFTFNDEIIKNQLANIANEPSSGLVNPDPTKPPIFLPETEVKNIDSVATKEPVVKNIKHIYPIAY